MLLTIKVSLRILHSLTETCTFVMLLEEADGNLDVIRECEGLVGYIVRRRRCEEDVVRYHVSIDYHAVHFLRPRCWLKQNKRGDVRGILLAFTVHLA